MHFDIIIIVDKAVYSIQWIYHFKIIIILSYVYYVVHANEEINTCMHALGNKKLIFKII